MARADISLTTIVLAALALIVLIVLIAIFMGKINIFSEDLVNCGAKGGSCTSDACDGAVVQNTNCQTGGQICCVGLGFKT